MAYKTLFAECPNGQLISRRTEANYTHAVARIDTCTEINEPRTGKYMPNPSLGQYVGVSWHNSLLRATEKARKHSGYVICRVVDAPAPTAKQPKTAEVGTNRAPAKQAKSDPLEQGFPAIYLRPDGKRFRMGMDARAKSDLRAAVAGKSTGKELHIFSKAQAELLLAKRGW